MKSESSQREFLYVAHNFPPLIGGGIARTEQNSQVLREYNWYATLLVSTADNSEDVDRKYAEMGIEVLRGNGVIVENRVRGLPRGMGKKKASLSAKLLRTCANWLLVPDRQVLWKYPAQRLAIKASKRHNWRCVFGTLPPISASWIGQNVAKRLNIPFILEYRDIISDKFEGGPPSRIHRSIIRCIERSLIRSASEIVVVSPGIRDWVMQRHNLGAEKIAVIPSGYLPQDKEYFDSLPRPQNKQFTMVYAGGFYRQRKPDTILKAVKFLIDRKEIPSDKVRVVLISNLMPSAISDFGLQGIAEAIPMMPREKVLRWYAKSDLLLMICDKCDYQNLTIPGKFFEYLMTERPILGLMDKNSVTAGLMEQSGAGLIADADDVEEAAAKLRILYKQWDSGKLEMRPNKQTLEDFNCFKLVKQLASVLDQSCNRD